MFASTLTLVPGAPRGGTYEFAVGTAGSAVLVCQSVLPVLLGIGYLYGAIRSPHKAHFMMRRQIDAIATVRVFPVYDCTVHLC